jgi:hypothetical protein
MFVESFTTIVRPGVRSLQVAGDAKNFYSARNCQRRQFGKHRGEHNQIESLEQLNVSIVSSQQKNGNLRWKHSK